MTGGAGIVKPLLIRVWVVILDAVVELVIAELLDDLNLSFEIPALGRWVGGTLYGRGRSSRR